MSLLSLLSFLGLSRVKPKAEAEAQVGKPEVAPELPQEDSSVYCDPDSGNARAIFSEAGVHLIESPEDCERFFSQLPPEESKENLWILKPASSSRGRGIRILWQFEELRNLYANPAKYLFDPATNRYVIQRYIRNPLLLKGRKSEIRI